MLSLIKLGTLSLSSTCNTYFVNPLLLGSFCFLSGRQLTSVAPPMALGPNRHTPGLPRLKTVICGFEVTGRAHVACCVSTE